MASLDLQFLTQARNRHVQGSEVGFADDLIDHERNGERGAKSELITCGGTTGVAARIGLSCGGNLRLH
jgi:hypothetical protein